MLLAQAIMMTSPLVATLGLSLMIPLSVFADYVRGLANLSPQFFVGTLAVFVGFLLEIQAEEKVEGTQGGLVKPVDDPDELAASEPAVERASHG